MRSASLFLLFNINMRLLRGLMCHCSLCTDNGLLDTRMYITFSTDATNSILRMSQPYKDQLLYEDYLTQIETKQEQGDAGQKEAIFSWDAIPFHQRHLPSLIPLLSKSCFVICPAACQIADSFLPPVVLGKSSG